MRWYPCDGWWPRTVAWLCRHNVKPAKAYAARKIVEEQDDDRMGAVLSACWNSQKPVFATEDENGTLIIEVME